MIAEIVSIGDELLIGQVINTNAAWLAENLNMTGVRVNRIITLPDEHDELISGLKESMERADLVIITGGLGPTRDDITKNVLCRIFDSHLVVNHDILNGINVLFRKRGYKMTPLNEKQAEVPHNCIPLQNQLGTAPGLWFEKNGKIVVSVPGVPFEMKELFAEQILPRLKGKLPPGFIIHKTILTQGVGESFLADMIREWEEKLPANIKLAYLPQPGIVRLRMTATGQDENALNKQVSDELSKLKKIIGELAFGYDNDTLEAVIGRVLSETGRTLSTAESCTGGYIAHIITSVAGSSAYYKGSVVSYANDIKTGMLGVREETLIKHGAVSEETVIQMAENIRVKFQTDYSIAVSGIAGPDGGTDDKPVGTVWVAVALPDKTITKKFLFGDNRMRNIQRAALSALNLLRLNIPER